MRKTSLTSRRFYNAFYRWTLLTSEPQACHAIRASSSAARSRLFRPNDTAKNDGIFVGKSSTNVVYDRARKDLINRHFTPSQRPPEPATVTTEQKNDEEEEDFSWLDTKVQTSSEGPFDTLEPWDEAIRYKSSAGVMLQFALPADVVARIEGDYVFSVVRSVRVEVGGKVTRQTKNGDAVAVQSVLLSGTVPEVSKLRHLIRSYKGQEGPADAIDNRSRSTSSLAGVEQHPEERDTTPSSEWIPLASINDVEQHLEEAATSPPSIEERAPWGQTPTTKPKDFSPDRTPTQAPAVVTRNSSADGTHDHISAQLVFEGTRDAIQQTRLWIQAVVDGVCRDKGIERMVVKEVVRKEPRSFGVQDSKSAGSDVETADSKIYTSPAQYTSIFTIPDPDGKKTLWDSIEPLLSGNQHAMNGVRELKLCAIVGNNDLVDEMKRQIQKSIDSTCDRLGMRREPLHENHRSISLARHRYTIHLALPDGLPLEHREAMIENIAKEDPTFRQGLMQNLHEGVELTEKDGVFAITGPVRLVLRTVKEIFKRVYFGMRRGGMEMVPLKVVMPLQLVQERPDGHVNSGERGEGKELQSMMPPQRHLREEAEVEREPKVAKEPQVNNPEERHGSSEPENNEPTKRNVELAENFKTALRVLTHPVVLVTSTHRKPRGTTTEQDTVSRNDDRLANHRGVTISSFTSVTLSPYPIISFNLRVPSRSWDVILDSGYLSVHVLNASPEGAAIASAFTQPYDSPSEPFQRLQQLGAGVYPVNWSRHVSISGLPSPDGSKKKGVLCYLYAKLIRDKCVEVGDHVIAVARVIDVHFTKELMADFDDGVVDGLTYAQKGFRGSGTEIEPVEIPELGQVESKVSEEVADTGTQTDKLRGIVSSKPKSIEAAAEVVENQVGKEDFESMLADGAEQHPGFDEQVDIDLSPHLMNFDIGNQITAGLNSAASSTLSSEELAADFSKQAELEAVRSTMNDVEVAVDNMDFSAVSEEQIDETMPIDESHKQQLTTDDEMSLRGAEDATKSAGVASGHQHFTGNLERPSLRQQHSAPPLISSFSIFSKRLYSTERHDSNRFNSPISQVTTPSLLKATVADYLGVDEELTRPRQIQRHVLRAKREAEWASARLERALAAGSLDLEESARLEGLIARNERLVARNVAIRSAEDLRRMLDNGQVINSARVQWLESSIEKGQAALLEEAKLLRALLESGKIAREQFQTVRQTLEQHNQLLSTEAMRLRQMVDEEGDDGGHSG